MPHGVCKHCGGPPRWLAGRGLCTPCHKNLEIRDQYPLLRPRNSSDDRDREYEPTEAELDALIAEQMRCLPAWWVAEEQRRLETGGGPPRAPRVVKTRGI